MPNFRRKLIFCFRKIKKYRPHYVDVEFKSQPVKRIKKTDFDKALIKAARKQGLEYPVNNLKVCGVKQVLEESYICMIKEYFAGGRFLF